MRRLLPLAKFAGPAGLALLAGLAAPAPGTAAAAPAPAVTISGKLPGQPGMTVLAVSPNGRAKPAKLTSAGVFSFRLAPAVARDLTLQLIDARGRYAGPVVLTSGSGKAYTALAGKPADLGTLHLDSGWARVTRAMPRGTVDVATWARADSHGKPTGAGKLGFVRTVGGHAVPGPQPVTAAAPASGAGADPDHDGVPSLFDADANGNGLLDRADPAAPAAPGIDVRLSTALAATFGQTINANAGPLTPSQLDALLTGDHTFASNFYLSEMGLDRAYTGIDVNCSALTYCAAGTGTATMDGMDDHGVPFSPTAKWADYNTDGSGLPNLTHYPSQHSWSVNVLPHVTSADIHPGDTFQVNLRAGTETVTVPTSLSTYFVTTPAITRWADGTGTPASVTYPVTSEATSRLSASSGQLTLSFWQPQRPAIPGAGETTSYIDMGHLRYGLILGIPGHQDTGCGGFFTGLSTGLRDEYPVNSHNDNDRLFPLHDQAGDHAPGPDRTLSFTVDLHACALAAGYDPTGHELHARLQAVTESTSGGMDRASQEFTIQL